MESMRMLFFFCRMSSIAALISFCLAVFLIPQDSFKELWMWIMLVCIVLTMIYWLGQFYLVKRIEKEWDLFHADIRETIDRPECYTAGEMSRLICDIGTFVLRFEWTRPMTLPYYLAWVKIEPVMKSCHESLRHLLGQKKPD